MAERKGITLPQEFLTAAAQGGLRQSILLQYALLQVGRDHCSQRPALAAACTVLLQISLALQLLAVTGRLLHKILLQSISSCAQSVAFGPQVSLQDWC